MSTTDPSDQVVASEANEVIKSARNCYDRGEIEPGIKRGKCHVLRPDKSGKCYCGDIDLSKYSKMILS